MIRRLSITVDTFIRNEIPAHLRSYADMLALFRGLLAPFKAIADEWLAWRNVSITRARVTGETASLQWYLNSLYDSTLQRIEILTAGLSGVPIGINSGSEAAIYASMGLQATEPAAYVSFPLPGEDSVFGFYSFIVRVPTALTAQQEAIRGIVEQYRFASRTYKIVLF